MGCSFSADQLVHDLSMHIGESEVAAGVAVGEFFVVEADQLQQGCMQVVTCTGFSTALKPNSSVAPCT